MYFDFCIKIKLHCDHVVEMSNETSDEANDFNNKFATAIT